MVDTPHSDPEPAEDDPGRHEWEQRHQAADTDVDPSSHEGMFRRMVHAWRRYESAPTVEQPKLAGALGTIVAEHEANGGDPGDDAKVANRWAMEKAERDAEEARKAEDADREAGVEPHQTLPGAPREAPAEPVAPPVSAGTPAQPMTPIEPPVPANAAVGASAVPDGTPVLAVPDSEKGAPDNPAADTEQGSTSPNPADQPPAVVDQPSA